jgi:hypothetical protein
MLTAVALLSGCTSLNSPPEARPVPMQVPAALPVAAVPSAPAPRVATRQPRELMRIDNTSIESFRASWQRLNASLSPAEKTKLNGAVARLALARYPGMTDLPKNLRDSPIVPETIRDQIHGLSYAEIMALSP